MNPEEELHFNILKKIQEDRRELDKTELESIKFLKDKGYGLAEIAPFIGISHQGLRHRLVTGYYNVETKPPRQRINKGKK